MLKIVFLRSNIGSFAKENQKFTNLSYISWKNMSALDRQLLLCGLFLNQHVSGHLKVLDKKKSGGLKHFPTNKLS